MAHHDDDSAPTTTQPLQRRTLGVLVAAQALAATGAAAASASGGIVAARVVGDGAAGLPLAALVLGSAVAAVPITRLMDRAGRRAGLTAAYAAGAFGAGLVVLAAAQSAVLPLLVGSAFLGAGNTGVALTRYAAADLAEPARRARAMGTVMLAASAGSVLAPSLMGFGGTIAAPFRLPPDAGLFLLAVPAYIVAAAAVFVLLRPDPLLTRRGSLPATAAGEAANPRARRPRVSIRSAPHSVLAVLAGANFVMVAMMAVAPLHLHRHGTGAGGIGLAVAMHVGAMHAPSPVVGMIADRFGGRAVATLGASTLAVSALWGAMLDPGDHHSTIGVLALLGLGWCAAVIGGSRLLMETFQGYAPTEAEGMGEVVMGIAAGLGAALAGPAAAAGGLAAVCGGSVMVSLAVLIVLERSRRSTAPVVAPLRPRAREFDPGWPEVTAA